MSEKRKLDRKKKRIKVRYGVDVPKRLGFTEDLTAIGLFVITAQPEKPGIKLKLQITLPDGEEVLALAQVLWGKKVPAQMIHLARKGGMGLKFIAFQAGEAAFKAYVAGLSR
jgi:hypothetical protein